MRTIKELQMARESILRAYMLNMVDYDDARASINAITRDIEKEANRKLMKKRIPAFIARIMYELKKRCMCSYWCNSCPAHQGKICQMRTNKNGIPADWNISEEDVCKIEREEMVKDILVSFIVGAWVGYMLWGWCLVIRGLQ